MRVKDNPVLAFSSAYLDGGGPRAFEAVTPHRYSLKEHLFRIMEVTVTYLEYVLFSFYSSHNLFLFCG